MPDATCERLTPKFLAEFFNRLQTRERIVGKGTKKVGVKDSTVETYRSKLNTYFEWLVMRGHIAINPLKGIPRARPKYDDVKSLRRNEIDKIRAAAQNHAQNLLQAKRDKAMLYLLATCGLRRKELISLKVTDIDMERRLLIVKGESSKSKRTRSIPLNFQVVMCLEDYVQERKRHRTYTTPFLFVSLNEDAGLTNFGLKYWVDRLKRLSGVDFHLHQFRHTFAHNLGVNGTSAIQLQRLLGHTDLRMTQAYVRSLSAEDLRPEMEKLNMDQLL
jgi:integrase/recombinase XerD